jgi:hypothetical protein
MDSKSKKSIGSLDDLYNDLDDELNSEDLKKSSNFNDLNNSKANWLNKYELYRIYPNKAYPEEIPILEVKSDSGYSKISSIGNILTIVGKAKSRKTFFLSLVVSSFLKRENNNEIFRTNIPKDKNKILVFDTEQSNTDAQVIYERVKNQINGESMDNLIVLGLRTLSPAERLSFIEETINNIDDVFLVIIDGIRDLLLDINNAIESTLITHKLMKWSGSRKLHIINVIHQNKIDNNPRGHIGSELKNRSESVISIEKKNEVSIVKQMELRGKDFKSFAFSINEYGTPFLIDGYNEKNKKEAFNQQIPENFDLEYHKSILTDLIFHGQKYGKVELCTLLKNEWAKKGFEITNKAMFGFIDYYSNNGLIRRLGENLKAKYILV